MLDEKTKIFVIYVATLKALLSGMTIHFLRKTWIAALKQNKALAKISNKYSNFADIFLKEKILMLLKQTNFNKYAIELENDNQLLYKLIYSLSLIDLETLKTYIKMHMKTGFIWPYKSSAGTSILFNKKPDSSLQLCVNY